MAAYFQPFLLSFDDGTDFEIQTSTRDMLALEKAGVDIESMPNIEASYLIAFQTLKRYHKLGKTPAGFVMPTSADELGDLADLIPVEGFDEEGKDSGQGQPTGT